MRDVSRVFQHALNNHGAMKGEIYNVGLSDANVSKKELCEHIQKQLPNFIFIDEQLFCVKKTNIYESRSGGNCISNF